MKKYLALSVMAFGLSMFGCGKSEGERLLEDAAQKMEASQQEMKAKTDAALDDAAKVFDQAKADSEKLIEQAQEQTDAATSALENLKDVAQPE